MAHTDYSINLFLTSNIHSYNAEYNTVFHNNRNYCILRVDSVSLYKLELRLVDDNVNISKSVCILDTSSIQKT